MKKKHLGYLLMLFCLVCGLSSCSNDDNFTAVSYQKEVQPDVEVTTVAQWIAHEGNGTRGGAAEVDEPVLHFKNREAYERITKELMKKSDFECMNYFKQIGFNGAYAQIVEADDELEKIFDNDDPALLQHLIAKYKAKYKDKFVFNAMDTFDITPNLPFKDEKLVLVGNMHGMVVVGNELIKPGLLSTRAFPTGPIEPGFRASKGGSVTLKHKKYKSTMTLGRIVNGEAMAIEFKTTKKTLFWRKSVRASHSVDLGLNNGSINPVYSPVGVEVVILRGLSPRHFSPTYDAEIKNFKSSKCSGSASASLKNIALM